MRGRGDENRWQNGCGDGGGWVCFEPSVQWQYVMACSLLSMVGVEMCVCCLVVMLAQILCMGNYGVDDLILSVCSRIRLATLRMDGKKEKENAVVMKKRTKPKCMHEQRRLSELIARPT